MSTTEKTLDEQMRPVSALLFLGFAMIGLSIYVVSYFAFRSENFLQNNVDNFVTKNDLQSLRDVLVNPKMQESYWEGYKDGLTSCQNFK